MGVGVISEAERREFACLHVLKRLDPKKEDGFRYICVKCHKPMKRLNGIVLKESSK